MSAMSVNSTFRIMSTPPFCSSINRVAYSGSTRLMTRFRCGRSRATTVGFGTITMRSSTAQSSMIQGPEDRGARELACPRREARSASASRCLGTMP